MKTTDILTDDQAKRFVEALKSYMEQHNVATPAQLAKRIGIPRSTMGRWMGPKPSIIMNSVVRVGHSLALNIGWIFHGRGTRGAHLHGEAAAIEKLMRRMTILHAEGAQVELQEVMEDMGLAVMRFLYGHGIPVRLSIDRGVHNMQVVLVADDPNALFTPVMLYLLPGATEVQYEMHCGDLANPLRYQWGTFCVPAMRDVAHYIRKRMVEKASGKAGVSGDALREQFEVALSAHHNQHAV